MLGWKALEIKQIESGLKKTPSGTDFFKNGLYFLWMCV